MYGSGSLRPPGTNPTMPNQNFKKTIRKPTRNPPTLGPQINGYQIPLSHQPSFPILHVPSILTQDDLHDFNWLSSSRSGGYSRSGGMYGGRPEYSSGRPRDIYPFDTGFIKGRGYDQGTPREYWRHGRIINPGFIRRVSYMKEPGSDPGNVDNYDGCNIDCGEDFLCIEECRCIAKSSR